MTTKDVLISQKVNNYNYAPGIATYGIDGKTGETGKDGNNIYFTDFNLKDINDLQKFAVQIVQNFLPLQNSTIKISRSYKNDDLFFDKMGIIYKLKEIDNLLNNIESLTGWDAYFVIAGQISIADDSSIFIMQDNRLILNSSLYGGYDIITGPSYNDVSNIIDKNAVVNIISNNVNENDNIEMVNIQSIDDVDIEDGKLQVYYKTTENAFYLDSNTPIVINGDVKLNTENNTNNEYDNFSTVLTSNDTITYFKHICDKLRYNVLYDSSVNQYKLIIFQNNEGRDLLDYIISRKDTVFGKIYSNRDDQTLIKLNNVVNGPVNDSNKLEHYVATKTISLSSTISDCSIGETVISNTSIHVAESHNNLNNSEKIEITLDPIQIGSIDYSKEFTDKMFTIIAQQIADISIYNIQDDVVDSSNQSVPIRQQIYKNINSVCKFTFNTNDFNDEHIIKLNIKPALEELSGIPVVLDINIPNDIYGQNSLYFRINYGEDKFVIDNILISQDNNLISNGNITQKYQIETYIPGDLDSVDRFALLHNTEVFINYQNYRNDVEQKQEETDQKIKKLKGIYLTSYNPYDYNATGKLVPDFGKCYYYSGQTIMWNNQLCYVWDRYDIDLAAEFWPDYECKILTNSLNLTLPFTINSPEFVASLNGNDRDGGSHIMVAAEISNEEVEHVDHHPYTRLLPDEYKGLCVLKRVYE